MERGNQLSDRITQMLLEEIRSGIYADRESLPPELDLAEKLKVSRNMVRECLTRLEREGWVTRKHGVGTLINKSVVNVHTRLDLNYELSQTLEMIGKHAETALVRSRMVSAAGEMAMLLKLKPEDQVFRVSRLIKANGKPAIFCIDYIPAKLIIDDSYRQEDLEPPIFSFLNKFCGGISVETNLAELRALPATEEVSEAMEIPQACGLLFLSEVGFDLRSKPVLYSEEYFIDRVIRHMIVRKKI